MVSGPRNPERARLVPPRQPLAGHLGGRHGARPAASSVAEEWVWRGGGVGAGCGGAPRARAREPIAGTGKKRKSTSVWRGVCKGPLLRGMHVSHFILLLYTVIEPSVMVSARGYPGSTCISPVWWLERCKSLQSTTLLPVCFDTVLQLQRPPMLCFGTTWSIAPARAPGTLCTYSRWFSRPLGSRHSLLQLPISARCVRVLLRFRTGCHTLPIVSGRRSGVPRPQRSCLQCASSVVGDERHMVF